MSAKTLVVAASCASGLALVACIIGAGFLFQDINNFYDGVMNDMEDFKVP